MLTLKKLKHNDITIERKKCKCMHIIVFIKQHIANLYTLFTLELTFHITNHQTV
jgi:hypothetical protein